MNRTEKDSRYLIAEEAAEWFLTLAEAESDSRNQEFVRWLSRSPEHIEEFLQITALNAELNLLADDADSSSALSNEQQIDLLVEEARSNVVSLNESTTLASITPSAEFKPRSMVAMPRAIAASLAAFALVVGLLYVALMPQAQLYQTGLGEQRVVMLPDGSVVEMNTQSTLELAYSDSLRLVRLNAGEAIFDVAKDASRPFRVQAGDISVDVIGTRFNIYRQTRQTVVTVVDGMVAVDNAGSSERRPDQQIRVEKGAQVAISVSGEIKKQDKVDLNKAIAWRDRRLVFSNDSLSTVVREVNRYNPRRLIIINAALAEKRISGTFKANQPETLVAFLQQVADVDIVLSDNGQDWQIQ